MEGNDGLQQSVLEFLINALRTPFPWCTTGVKLLKVNVNKIFHTFTFIYQKCSLTTCTFKAYGILP